MIAAMDEGIGQVMDKLKEAGLENNTLVFFMSDNGGREARDIPAYWHSGASNRPLRGEKTQLWEGGIRVPFILRWPAVIDAGQVSHEPVINLDVLPTCIAAAGGQLPSDRIYDGKNLAPFIQGKRRGPVHDSMVWTMDPDRYYAVRKGPWKLLHEKGQDRLFNLDADIGERHDLAEHHPNRVRDLKSVYIQMRKQMKLSLSESKQMDKG
jgi:arylsulfatase A-like enzyme